MTMALSRDLAFGVIGVAALWFLAFFAWDHSQRADAILHVAGISAFFDCGFDHDQLSQMVEKLHNGGASWKESGEKAADLVRICARTKGSK
jgi:hypothetical protein